MAGPEHLQSLIYHENQQPGSLLCAQHALNSLLQGNYFTAPDLSELAHHIDHLEQSYNEGIRGQASANMDDTGFFSVQVLENALHVWGLSFVRWRSEAMKPYHDRPHTQLAFVLNQNQHWYTLRRFGSSNEGAHWFNLDSTMSQPQWISRTYLGMFLHQAEQEGYSVFVVLPIDPSNANPLPRCDADDVASTLSDPSSASSTRSQIPLSDPGFEDEDMDLQAALQASLASAEREAGANTSGASKRLDNYPPPLIPSSRTFPGFPETASFARESTSGGRSNIPPNQDHHGNADVDLVSASMKRNRIIMERMRQEQEEALRERYEEEIAEFDQVQDYSRLRRRRETDVEDEDELFRRAMEESLAERRFETGDDGDTADLEDDEDYNAPATGTGTHAMHRVYDDDDAELQAALKASLETVPAGFTLPPSVPPPPPQRLANEHPLVETMSNRPVEESEAETETETETETDAEGVTKEEVSVEEMRRRRLARFGG